MQECERQRRGARPQPQDQDQPPMTSAPLPPASRVAATATVEEAAAVHQIRLLSSSITSFNPYSSSDYIKSQSSDYHAPSTDPIKTFSTTSYDVQSTTANNTTNSTMSTTSNTNTISSCTTNPRETNPETTASCSVSPQPLQLTPVRGTSSSPSQYNSSEELAAIFGIEEQPKQRKQRQHQQHHTGKGDAQGSPAARASTASASASASATTNAPAMPPATATTSSATNRVLNVASDVTTTSPTSSNTSSNDSASSCSSICNYKLETIPEQDQDHDQDQEEDTALKLSPNFNRIYASKIRIVMEEEEPLVLDEVATIQQQEVTEEQTKILPAVGVETHFDSLSSLEEEVSSNPDSGNVSLTDYPLGGNHNHHANASLELQTTYNSRFEVREHYVSEVSISASEESSTDEEEQTDTERTERGGDLEGREDGFPPLPTEEELLESLREEREHNERGAESVELSKEISGQTELRIEEDALSDDSLEEDIEVEVEVSSSEVTDNEESESSLESDAKLDETVSLSEEVYKLASETLKIQENPLDEEPIDERNLSEVKPDQIKHREEKLDERKLNERKLDETLENECRFELEEAEFSLKQSEESDLKPNESEFNETLDECDSAMQFPRRKSIVYETPALNLSISEVKLNYETKVGEEMEAEPTTPVTDEANQSIDNDNDNDDDIPINDTSARNEEEPQEKQGKSSGDVSETRQGLPAAAVVEEEEEEEQPTTSSKALSVFGEVRTVAPAADAAVGGAVARGGLTTLEHVFVACTVGLITPNDLLTLCLIVIGVIIIIAIALAA
ncbi:GL24658 [Drosophila persimilis]|uniref:GL24658 n=1 Tax=Drosophila persimilis TaxID=7234 RepID=B4H5W1_DROPE|nr:GL24658 [Drosophila persimilis]